MGTNTAKTSVLGETNSCCHICAASVFTPRLPPRDLLRTDLHSLWQTASLKCPQSTQHSHSLVLSWMAENSDPPNFLGSGQLPLSSLIAEKGNKEVGLILLRGLNATCEVPFI